MKKLGFYAAAVAALVFTLWFCTKDGMQPSEGAAPAGGSVKCVMLESLSMGRRVSVEDPEDIERLSDTLSTLSEENGVVVDLDEDFPESMRDWTIEWLSQEGESLALVEISSVGTVFRGGQCFNFLGGEIFDMDYLRGLLLGLPEAGDSQEPIDIESIGRANLSGNGGDTVVISGGAVDELKDILRGINFYQSGKEGYGGGGGYSLQLFDSDERSLGKLSLWGSQVYFDGMEGGGFDSEWINRMFDTMPEADYGERYPIVDFKYDEDVLEFSIGTAANGAVVRVTDPELLERLEGPVREMEFKACGPYDGGEPTYWINRYFADNYYSFAIKIVDKESIEYGGWLYKLMDGKKFDLDLYAQLTDPSGPYKDHPGVMYWKEGDPPMPAITPRPSPAPSGDPEPTPAGTAVPYIMDDPPKERIFDLDGGYVVMFNNNGGGTVDIKGEEFASLAEELAGLRFELREQCSIDSCAMHALEEDIELYHGNPLFTLTWFDGDGNEGAEFTARSLEGWIDCEGWYYQAKEGGIDMENLKGLMRTKDRRP